MILQGISGLKPIKLFSKFNAGDNAEKNAEILMNCTHCVCPAWVAVPTTACFEYSLKNTNLFKKTNIVSIIFQRVQVPYVRRSFSEVLASGKLVVSNDSSNSKRSLEHDQRE